MTSDRHLYILYCLLVCSVYRISVDTLERSRKMRNDQLVTFGGLIFLWMLIMNCLEGV